MEQGGLAVEGKMDGKIKACEKRLNNFDDEYESI